MSKPKSTSKILDPFLQSLFDDKDLEGDFIKPVDLDKKDSINGESRDLKNRKHLVVAQKMTTPTKKTVLKEIAFLLHVNIFKIHPKDNTREKTMYIDGRYVNVKQVIPEKTLPNPKTRDYTYALLTASKNNLNKYVGNVEESSQHLPYIIEADWETLCQALSVENEWTNRAQIKEALIDLNTISIRHNYESIDYGFMYLTSYAIGTKKDDPIILYFPSFRWLWKGTFSIPFQDYMKLPSPMSKAIFVPVFCFSNPKKGSFNPIMMSIEEVFVRIGKPEWINDSKRLKENFDHLHTGLLELQLKNYFDIELDGKSIASFDKQDRSNITNSTIISFKPGSYDFAQYNAEFFKDNVAEIPSL